MGMGTPLTRLMSATDFERQHPLVMHCLIVGLAFASYGIDRDDIVWRFIKHHGASTRLWEHGLFSLATVLIAGGAFLCTSSRKKPAQLTMLRFGRFPLTYLGQFLYAVGLASVLPLAGYTILIAGEGLRLLRLSLAGKSRSLPAVSSSQNGMSLGESARREALKWGVVITMVVFTITLRDRLADLMMFGSVVSAVLLNWRPFPYRKRRWT